MILPSLCIRTITGENAVFFVIRPLTYNDVSHADTSAYAKEHTQ